MKLIMATRSDALTEKMEEFAQQYVALGNAAEAYRRAYDVDENARDSWVYVEAVQLLDHPKIAPRIVEIRDAARRHNIFTVQQAAEEYEEARLLALSEANPSAAVSAVGGKVKLFGLEPAVKWKGEVTGKNQGPIKTEEIGAGASKLSAFIETLAERSGNSGSTDAE